LYFDIVLKLKGKMHCIVKRKYFVSD